MVYFPLFHQSPEFRPDAPAHVRNMLFYCHYHDSPFVCPEGKFPSYFTKLWRFFFYFAMWRLVGFDCYYMQSNLVTGLSGSLLSLYTLHNHHHHEPIWSARFVPKVVLIYVLSNRAFDLGHKRISVEEGMWMWQNQCIGINSKYGTAIAEGKFAHKPHCRGGRGLLNRPSQNR